MADMQAPAAGADFAQAQSAGNRAVWAIANSSDVELQMDAITDHWGGDAIVNNEWLLNDPDEWGYGPAPVLADGDSTSLAFVDWAFTPEWIDITYSTPDGRFIKVRLTEQVHAGNPAMTVLQARGLRAEATSNGRGTLPDGLHEERDTKNTLTIMSGWSPRT